MNSNFIIGAVGALITVPVILLIGHHLAMKKNKKDLEDYRNAGPSVSPPPEPTTKEELINLLRKKVNNKIN